MNIKKIIQTISLAISIIFYGCDNLEHDNLIPNNSNNVRGSSRISVKVDEANTKVSIDETVVRWVNGDKIYVAELTDNGTFTNLMEFQIDENSIADNGKSATFIGVSDTDILFSDKRYISVDCKSAQISDDGYIIIQNTPKPQSSSGSTKHIEDIWFMSTPIFELDNEGNANALFLNILSIVSLELKVGSNAKGSYTLKSVNFDAGTNYFSEDLVVLYDNTLRIASYTEDIKSGVTINIENNPKISNLESYTVSIPVYVDSNKMPSDFSVTAETAEGTNLKATFPSSVLTSGKLYSARIELEKVEGDREALMAIYNACGGKNWRDNTNWGSDKPLDDWYGVNTNSAGRVTHLYLHGGAWNSVAHRYNYPFGLTGDMPEEIGDLTELVSLWCFGNFLTSLDVSKNTKLKTLWCGDNSLEILDVSKNTALHDFMCFCNSLTALDVSMLTKLGKENLVCGDQKNNKTITVTMTAAQEALPVLGNDDLNDRVTVVTKQPQP